MNYTFKHSDGRNYRNTISGEVKLEFGKYDQKIIMKVFSSTELKITLTLNTKEAASIAHCLLASIGGAHKVSAGTIPNNTT